MNDQPSANGSNGRGSNGQFLLGNSGGPGNPGAKHARQLRERLSEALHKVCSPDRLVSVVDAVLKLAEAGDVQAAKLVFERIAGPPINSEIAERLDALETKLNPSTFDDENEAT